MPPTSKDIGRFSVTNLKKEEAFNIDTVTPSEDQFNQDSVLDVPL